MDRNEGGREGGREKGKKGRRGKCSRNGDPEISIAAILYTITCEVVFYIWCVVCVHKAISNLSL